eukprot:6931302-Pyramimonas_sp.AAC.1
MLHTDSAFAHDGAHKRGERECCGSRGAWSELWRAVWTKIHDWGGPSQICLVKVKGHCTHARVQLGLS